MPEPTVTDPVQLNPKVEVVAGQTVTKKAMDWTSLSANLSGVTLAGYLLMVALPAMEQRQIDRITEVKTALIETNRLSQLTRDEMRDARHDLTELRHDADRRSSMPKGGAPNAAAPTKQ